MISKGCQSLVPGLISIFLEMVWGPLINNFLVTVSMIHVYGKTT